MKNKQYKNLTQIAVCTIADKATRIQWMRKYLSDRRYYCVFHHSHMVVYARY